MSKRRVAALVAATFVLAGSTACGKLADKASEKGAEEVAESATGCKDVEIEGDGSSVKCDGAEFDAGGDASLPDGFPDELAPPEGAQIFTASADESSGTATYNLVLTVSDDAKGVYEAMKAQFERADYEITSDSFSEGTGGAGGSLTARNDTYEANALFGESSDGTGETSITYTVRELTEDERAETTTTTTTTDGDADDDRSSHEGGSDEGSSSDSSGSGEELPDGFPEGLIPDDASIAGAVKSEADGNATYYVVAGVDGDVRDVYDDLEAQVEDAGYEIAGDSFSTTGGVEGGVLSAADDQFDVALSVGPDDGSQTDRDVAVIITATEK